MVWLVIVTKSSVCEGSNNTLGQAACVILGVKSWHKLCVVGLPIFAFICITLSFVGFVGISFSRELVAASVHTVQRSLKSMVFM